MTTVNIVSFYANITKLGTRTYHCRFTQSKPDKGSHVVVRIHITTLNLSFLTKGFKIANNIFAVINP